MKSISFFIPLLLLISAIPTGFAINDEVVVIASTQADAILAAQYAREMGYKFVYTPSDSLSEEAEKTIQNAKNAIIIGGPNAVSENVKNQLSAKIPNVERVFGETRVETSNALFKKLITEKPEALKNVVIAEGFNEDVTPAALSFGAPVLYYSPENFESIQETLRSLNVENAVLMGSNIPNGIRQVASEVSKSTTVASGTVENIVKTVLSAAPRINPSIVNTVSSVVYSSQTTDPLMAAITGYAEGNFGSVVPVTGISRDSINDVISSTTKFTSQISISSDNKEVSESISKTVSESGATPSTTTPSSSGGNKGGSGSSVKPEPEVYFIGIVYDANTDKIVAMKQLSPSSAPDSYSGNVITPLNYTIVSKGSQHIKFADMGSSKDTGNHLEIVSEEKVTLPKLTINSDVSNKSYGGVNITFLGNANALNLVYPIANGAITYGNPLNVTYYGNENFVNNGDKVTAHVISNRQDFRDAMTKSLNGDTTAFINMLNNADNYTTQFNSTSKTAKFMVTPKNHGENIVIITHGDNGLIPLNNNVTVLGFSGFEFLKYRLDMTKAYTSTSVSTTYDFNIGMNLNQTPANNVRYGLIGITKSGYGFTIDIEGKDTNNKNFDVSIVGNKGSSNIVGNSKIVSLNAIKVKEILEAAFTSKTAGAAYSGVSKTNSTTLSIVIDH
ncbi:conserved hypothetical protein [Methanococcus vannielii SB]|jgi:putative cell wall-binding protein|uniref:Cell wall binding repeat 2-containing protein n=1 Tax=Methanococcus vannielii (strain ATCC 35089 / DSM 1224 / JCM 13029 / OCM 148 / SB) TaxID=406327 RepID=A6UNM6_METVS|nr:cell wall-binding repeat-containing protein [Methanococcus vannielii]ABR54098.1 conserved hypothetical protein [Methanococcus vannielii SB]